jgi:hypothetical protein
MERIFLKLEYWLFVITIIASSSCAPKLEIYESRENYREAELISESNIADDVSSFAHTIGLGMNRAGQIGYDMSYLFENKSRVDLSLNYNFGKANQERIFGREVVNHTDKRFKEAVSMALDFSYPLLISSKTKKRPTDVFDKKMQNWTFFQAFPGSPMMMSIDSVFYVVHKFKRLSTINLLVGVDHYYNVFSSDFYRRHLSATEPDGVFRFPDVFDNISLNNGTYYLKFGGSYNIYTNSNLKATYDNREFKGRASRELQFNASLNYGLLSTISNLNVYYTSLEDGQEIIRVTHLNPLDYDISYAAFGGQASFSWTQYFFNSFVMKYTIFMGMAPGYYQIKSENFIIGASLRFGIGKMK